MLKTKLFWKEWKKSRDKDNAFEEFLHKGEHIHKNRHWLAGMVGLLSFFSSCFKIGNITLLNRKVQWKGKPGLFRERG